MALKSFNELIKIDVRPQCDTRDAKDENGKTIKVPYLSWGKCVKLLHENGANDVWYAPVECPTTHTYLWPQAKVSTSKGRDTECWFVRVLIHIDDLEFVYKALSYDKGQFDERSAIEKAKAELRAELENNKAIVSTTVSSQQSAAPVQEKVQLTEQEKRIAAAMGLSESEYVKWK